jgi:phospholipid-binding lipoprotein MlaA
MFTPVLRRLAPFAALALAACSGTPGTIPPQHRLAPGQEEALRHESIWDPLEPWNRGVYNFNKVADDYVLLPAVRAYEFVVPDFAEERVTDFFNNLLEIRNGLNGALQLRAEPTGQAIGRFMINSSLGVFGLFDVDTPLGYPVHDEDFGQTLGWWGAGTGPYLVLPILGPSNLRDTTGLVADTAANSTLPLASTINEEVFFNPAVYALYVVDRRRIQAFRYYESGNAFEYDLVRYLYTRKRELDIRK